MCAGICHTCMIVCTHAEELVAQCANPACVALHSTERHAEAEAAGEDGGGGTALPSLGVGARGGPLAAAP